MSKSTVYKNFAEAVADIPSDSVVGFGGFSGVGAPLNLMTALANRTDVRGIKAVAISVRTGGNGAPEGLLDIATMAKRGIVSELISSADISGKAEETREFAECLKAGTVTSKVVPQGVLAERLCAASAGIAAFYSPVGVGTEIAHGKEERKFGERRFILETALGLDVALLRATRADTAGNAQFAMTQRNIAPVMAAAARRVIVEVEEPLVPAGALGADAVHLPGLFVHGLVEIGKGDLWPVPRPRRNAPGLGWSGQGLSPLERCKRLVREFEQEWVVNLGIGMPTLCADLVPQERNITLHSENGLIGYGPFAKEGEENLHLINAGGGYVTTIPDSAIVDHVASFAMVRSGRIDATVLGAYEVSGHGDIANWKITGQPVGRIGGAMDLAAGVRKVFVVMDHTTKDGQPRLVETCNHPLTAQGIVSLVITNLGLFETSRDGLKLLEIAPGIALDEIRAKTGCGFEIASGLKVIDAAAR